MRFAIVACVAALVAAVNGAALLESRQNFPAWWVIAEGHVTEIDC